MTRVTRTSFLGCIHIRHIIHNAFYILSILGFSYGSLFPDEIEYSDEGGVGELYCAPSYMKSEASKQALAIFQLKPSSGVKMGVAVSPWVNCTYISRQQVNTVFGF